MADEMKSKITEQIKMVIACMEDLEDMYENQISKEINRMIYHAMEYTMDQHKNRTVEDFKRAVQALQGSGRYAYICSCGNELICSIAELDDVLDEEIECASCDRTRGWISESESEVE